MHPQNHIGVFDSGLGGISVYLELKKLMPNETFIYYGDTLHVPYGNRSKELITEYSLNIIDFLHNNNCKALVVACNTMCSVCLPTITNKSTVPVYDVISPGAKFANKVSSGRVGLIATSATVNSTVYDSYVVDKNTKLFKKACTKFVEIVESGNVDSEYSAQIIRADIEDMRRNDIDTLILGCTHFPFILPQIKKYLSADIQIIDPAINAAQAVYLSLKSMNMLNKKKHSEDLFFISGNTDKFDEIAKTLAGINIKSMKPIMPIT